MVSKNICEILAGFRYFGKTTISFVAHKMISDNYVKFLDNVLINFANDVMGKIGVFSRKTFQYIALGILRRFLKNALYLYGNGLPLVLIETPWKTSRALFARGRIEMDTMVALCSS